MMKDYKEIERMAERAWMVARSMPKWVSPAMPAHDRWVLANKGEDLAGAILSGLEREKNALWRAHSYISGEYEAIDMITDRVREHVMRDLPEEYRGINVVLDGEIASWEKTCRAASNLSSLAYRSVKAEQKRVNEEKGPRWLLDLVCPEHGKGPCSGMMYWEWAAESHYSIEVCPACGAQIGTCSHTEEDL